MPKQKSPEKVDPDSVGRKLRALRKERNMTLGDLSAKTGISVSSLSRIENTRLSLNVEKIRALAAVLQVAPETFLQHTGSAPQASAPSSRRSGAPRLEVDRLRDRQLSREGEVGQHYMFADVSPRNMDCIYFEIEAVPIWESEFICHFGEKMLIVLEGELMAYVQGRSPVLLESGDTLYMDSDVWHSVVAANGKVARIVAVYSNETNVDPGNFETRHFTSAEWADLNS